MLSRTLATRAGFLANSLVAAAYVPQDSGLHLQISSQSPPSFPPGYIYSAFCPPEPPVAVLEVSPAGEPVRFSSDVTSSSCCPSLGQNYGLSLPMTSDIAEACVALAITIPIPTFPHTYSPKTRFTAFQASVLSLPPQSSSLPSAPSLPFLCSALDVYYSDYLSVIGMGENDLGVTLSGLYGDPLSASSLPLLQELLSSSKEKRHGVKFHARTTGLLLPPSLLSSLRSVGLRSVEVFLEGGDPKSFGAGLRGRGVDVKDEVQLFRQVCGFVAAAAEEGIKVKVGVRRGDADAAELAKGLGAVEVWNMK